MDEGGPTQKESFTKRFLAGQSSNIKKAFEIGLKIGWFIRLFFFFITLNLAIESKEEVWIITAVLLGASLIPQAYTWMKELWLKQRGKK